MESKLTDQEKFGFQKVGGFYMIIDKEYKKKVSFNGKVFRCKSRSKLIHTLANLRTAYEESQQQETVMSTEYNSVMIVGDYLHDIYNHCLDNDLLDAHDYDDVWDFRDRALSYLGMEAMGDCDFIGYTVPTSFTNNTKGN